MLDSTWYLVLISSELKPAKIGKPWSESASNIKQSSKHDSEAHSSELEDSNDLELGRRNKKLGSWQINEVYNGIAYTAKDEE